MINRIVVLACSLLLPFFGAISANASSSGVRWDFYSSGQGALLTAKHFRSFLGSDQVKTTVLMSAQCDRNNATPYVAAIIRPRGDFVLQAEHNMRMADKNGNWYFFLGRLDKLATANAGDQFARYGMRMKTTAGLFQMLTESGSRHSPRMELDPNGGGSKLEIYREEDRQKVRDFLATCERFAPKQASVPTQPSNAFACRDYANGPNRFLGNTITRYSEEVTSALCTPSRTDTRPANCFHYVMSKQFPWNRQGSTNWDAKNAAIFCSGSTDIVARTGCLASEIARTDDFWASVYACNRTN